MTRSTHAMTLMGVHLEKGKAVRWCILNSWGPKSGKNGTITMSEEWNQRFTFKFAINRKYLSSEVQGLLKGKIKDDFFIINCDTIVSTNLEKFYDHHKKNNYKITLVVAAKNFKLSYGSCQITKKGQLKKILEKPSMNYLVNVGLYLFKPEVINLVSKNEFLEMDTLIKKVKQRGGKIGVFPINEDNWQDIGQYWQDIGQ